MSSKRRLRRKACTGKVRHTTAEHARVAIREMARAGLPASNLEPYGCAFCSGYHVGHRRGSMRYTGRKQSR